MPKILVADDNTNIQKMVSLALEERGIKVVAVGNGEAAVRRIPDLDPDLVLADIFMPVRNGYEVCEFVKKDERFAHVPVILLVGAFDPLDEKEARRVGADGVLKKPFVPPDPLIAMVTSALEKNPRVAAELAKAKEAKMAPAEPIPSIDLSARPEPKPLPEFPEPSPEESALVYGFGKGIRPDAPADADDEIGEINGPVAVPRAQAAGDDEEEDAQSTTSDWRRSARDIEIPADVASQPAIASMADLEPINFPSEKDYPPRHVHRSEPEPETQPAAKNETLSASSSFTLRHVADAKPQIAPEPAASSSELPGALHPQAVSEPEPPVGAHAASVAPKLKIPPEPNATSAGGHWLDAVSSPQLNHPSGGWMDALSADPVAPLAAADPPLESTANSSDAAVESTSGFPAIEDAAATYESFANDVSVAPPHPVQEELETQPGHGQSFFADETEHQQTTAPEPEAQEAPEQVPSIPAAAGRDIELDADDSEPPLAFKDPALVEPPAVHVTPEPLLVEEDESAPSQYGTSAEATSPLHSFVVPTPEAPPAAPLPEAAAAAEFSVQAGSLARESSGDEIDERIPTMPPPNREALSHIPFLTPPPSFLSEMNSGAPQETPAADPETVDTVVQKVLEKLQPQLQELLSQGLLKPLVENLLQNELTKKR